MVKNSLFIVLILAVACSDPKDLSKEELLAYLEEEGNGLVKHASNGEMISSLRYKPSSLIALADLSNTDDQDSILAYYDQFLYLLLSFSYKETDLGSHPYLLPGEKVRYYLGQEVAKDISLRVGGIELDLADHIHVNMYGSTSSSDVLLVYKKGTVELGNLEFTIANGPLNMGKGHFEIKKHDIVSIPRLKLESS